MIKLLKSGGHFVDPNLEILARVAESLPKHAAATNADRFAAVGNDPADERGELERDDDDDDDDDDDAKPSSRVGEEDDRGAADADEGADEGAGQGGAWWSSDKAGRGRVFKKKTKRGDVIAVKRKVTVGPSDAERVAKKMKGKGVAKK